jgi:hypothetical protein
LPIWLARKACSAPTLPKRSATGDCHTFHNRLN